MRDVISFSPIKCDQTAAGLLVHTPMASAVPAGSDGAEDALTGHNQEETDHSNTSHSGEGFIQKEPEGIQ